jgi:flagellar motility protein MotE (MotC chaperone)
MNKVSPKFFVMLFAVVITMRTGYVVYTYKGDILTANAQEILGKTPKKPLNTDDTLETISDKILKQKPEKPKQDAYASKIARKSDVKNPKAACITGAMLKDTLEQLDYLNKREADIMEQQRLLETSDRRVREQVAKLKLMKQEILSSAKLADTTIDRESKRLISIYEKMKPKEAANIFNEMTPNVAAELLRTMKEHQSSEILAKMNPKNAYAITLSLAGGIKKTKDTYNNIKNN